MHVKRLGRRAVNAFAPNVTTKERRYIAIEGWEGKNVQSLIYNSGSHTVIRCAKSATNNWQASVSLGGPQLIKTLLPLLRLCPHPAITDPPQLTIAVESAKVVVHTHCFFFFLNLHSGIGKKQAPTIRHEVFFLNTFTTSAANNTRSQFQGDKRRRISMKVIEREKYIAKVMSRD